MIASVSSVSAAAVSGLNSEKSSGLPEYSFRERSELSSSRVPLSCVFASRKMSNLCATSTPNSRRLASVLFPFAPPLSPFCALPSHVACSTTPPTTPIKTRPTRPSMRYVPALNPTRHAPSVSLLAVAKNWSARSVSTFKSSDGAFCAPFSSSASGIMGNSWGFSSSESRGFGGA
jgi:hypothetical protein